MSVSEALPEASLLSTVMLFCSNVPEDEVAIKGSLAALENQVSIHCSHSWILSRSKNAGSTLTRVDPVPRVGRGRPLPLADVCPGRRHQHHTRILRDRPPSSHLKRVRREQLWV